MSSEQEQELQAFPEIPQGLWPLFEVWLNPGLDSAPISREQTLNMAELCSRILDNHIDLIYAAELSSRIAETPLHPLKPYLQMARETVYSVFLLSTRHIPYEGIGSMAWLRDFGDEARAVVGGKLFDHIRDRSLRAVGYLVIALENGAFPATPEKREYERSVDRNNGIWIPKGDRSDRTHSAAKYLDEGLYLLAREIVGRIF